MIQTTLIKYSVIAILVLLLSWSGYSKIKQIGFNEAEAKYSLIIKEYETNVNKKISSIETLASSLVYLNKENTLVLSKDINGIIKGMEGKTLAIVKDGKCVPSETFVNTINSINQRANESIPK